MKYIACRIHPITTLAEVRIEMPQYAKENVGGIPTTQYILCSVEDEHWNHVLLLEDWDVIELTEEECTNANWYGNERGWNPTDYDEYVSLGTNADLQLSSQYKEEMPDTSLPHVLSLMKKVKTREIENWYNNQYQQLNVQKSNQEQMTWQQQYDEAQDYKVDATAPTPLINKLMEIRGSSNKSDFVDKIVEKRTAWATSIGTIVGAMHKEKDSVKAAASIVALNKLDSARATPAGFHSGLLE
jgi:hypothetical protein